MNAVCFDNVSAKFKKFLLSNITTHLQEELENDVD